MENNKIQRILCLGDTHGRAFWKEVIEVETNFDLLIFMGDYFDSHDDNNTGDKQINNFKEILAFKKANPDKVIMLCGNHDYHYVRGVGETYSGYQSAYALEIGELVEKAINDGDIQMCYLYDIFFFSHAGLTKTWVKRMLAPNNINPLVNEVMVKTINDYLKYKPRIFEFFNGW